jgi:hypothetical protein
MSRRRAVRSEGVPMKYLAPMPYSYLWHLVRGSLLNNDSRERRQESGGCCDGPPNSLTLNYLMNGPHWRDAT